MNATGLDCGPVHAEVRPGEQRTDPRSTWGAHGTVSGDSVKMSTTFKNSWFIPNAAIRQPVDDQRAYAADRAWAAALMQLSRLSRRKVPVWLPSHVYRNYDDGQLNAWARTLSADDFETFQSDRLVDLQARFGPSAPRPSGASCRVVEPTSGATGQISFEMGSGQTTVTTRPSSMELGAHVSTASTWISCSYYVMVFSDQHRKSGQRLANAIADIGLF